jgi:hypothetical protein
MPRRKCLGYGKVIKSGITDQAVCFAANLGRTKLASVKMWALSRSPNNQSFGRRQSMLKKIILGIVVMLVVLIAVCLVLVMMQPAHYQVERSATINAPATTVFPLVNDFHKWDSWSPWAKLDPAMKTTFEGPAAGTGAMYSWAGNSQVGEGKMTITESRPSDLIKIKLEFIKPFAATNATDFTFTPSGNATNVKWTMAGDNNFIGKAFSLFMNMDKMIGADFEKGLAQMKTVAESGPK